MRQCSFTVDVDRDVNQTCESKVCAVSAPRYGSDAPRFASSAKGLEAIVDVLNSLGVNGTFFFEARTALEISKDVDLPSLMKGHEVACHGYDHEDLTGHRSGVPLDRGQIIDVLDRSAAVLSEMFGTSRLGFRAPYQACDESIETILFEKDFIYDSSKVRSLQDGPIWPYRTASGIIEVPVASGIDPRGKKIVGYLWPMHEGKRTIDDYVHLMERSEDGLFVIATHTWHMMENFSSGIYTNEEARRQKDLLRELLSKGLDMGFEMVRIADHLAENGIKE
ncbi:MAG: polysaccharide deacetylase family protein [Methanomassiliicoccales archaeon]|jgi:peptidoglycan/xylan/chitin deacetylase (PgdA/CDA1 family)